MGKLKRIIIGILAVITIAIIVICVWYNGALSGTGTADEVITIEVPLGSSSDAIANLLKENEAIKSTLAFKIYTKLNNVNSFQAGKYKITKNMNVPDIIEVLQTGKVLKDAEVRITFIEGKPFTYVVNQIVNNTFIFEQDLYELVKYEEYLDSLIQDYWFITDDIKNSNIYYSLEGYLFPDTYEFVKDVDAKELLKVLLNQMETVLEEYRNDIENSEYSVHEILTIASIIENEAIYNNDRKDVASVIYNRLKQNMSLGCDSTTNYGARVELGERELSMSEINSSNAYNTRGPNMEGKLPVGPICMPSKEAIEAAVFPNDTDYLYFVTDKNGKAYFTKTLSEHEKKISELKKSGEWAEF